MTTLDLMGRAKRLSNEELMTALARTQSSEHDAMAKAIVLLSEVDKRRLWAEKAVPSLFEFCVRYFGYSEGQAFRRIRAARSIRKQPFLLGMLSRREIHLTKLAAVFDLLAHPQFERIAREVGLNRKPDVERIVVKWAPKPDIRAEVRKIEPKPLPTTPPTMMPAPTPRSPIAAPAAAPTPIPQPLPPPAKVEVRLEERFAVKFMADAESHKDLMRAKDLLPNMDLNGLMKRALRLLREDAEKTARAKTARPQANPRSRRTSSESPQQRSERCSSETRSAARTKTPRARGVQRERA